MEPASSCHSIHHGPLHSVRLCPLRFAPLSVYQIYSFRVRMPNAILSIHRRSLLFSLFYVYYQFDSHLKKMNHSWSSIYYNSTSLCTGLGGSVCWHLLVFHKPWRLQGSECWALLHLVIYTASGVLLMLHYYYHTTQVPFPLKAALHKQSLLCAECVVPHKRIKRLAVPLEKALKDTRRLQLLL